MSQGLEDQWAMRQITLADFQARWQPQAASLLREGALQSVNPLATRFG